MTNLIRRGVSWLLCAVMVLLVLPVVGVHAQETAQQLQARDISDKKQILDYGGFSYNQRLFDGSVLYSVPMRNGAWLTLTSQEGIGSLYLLMGEEYGAITVTDVDTGREYRFDTQGFLHVFLDLREIFETIPETVTISFGDGDARVNELYIFTPGQVPSFVQKWEPSVEWETDLVLFSTHGDDEQLFFAGLLPYYAAERDYQVQVVYLTDHRNATDRRVHEMLDGLWAVGVKTYPVFGSFGDYHTTSLSEALERYRYKGVTETQLLQFVVEQLRRFRPKVAVGHDLNGEYGHGMHRLYADLLCKAVAISNDPAQFPELAEQYGVWDVPKTYLHLYHENKILMDWDQPLDSFGGMTAYEVTKLLGFPCHKTQQELYSWYFTGRSRASQIPEYSPCRYGLYRSTVGEDVQKNDFFENLTTYAQDAEMERELLAAEEARQQAAREEAEQAARETQAAEPPVTETTPQPQPQQPSGGTDLLSTLLAVLLAGALLGMASIITKGMGSHGRK